MSTVPGESAATGITVGVLSDTHGHLYPEVKQILAGVDHIIHAGDVGSARVLADLRTLAPVTAVRGNCDLDGWAKALPVRAELDLGGARILVGHIAARLWGLAEAGGHGSGAGYSVVITGHSHLAAIEHREGTVYLNPGSAGPGRFGRSRTVALLTIRPESADGPGCAADVGAEIVIVPS
jgi:putative phosphoesterase